MQSDLLTEGSTLWAELATVHLKLLFDSLGAVPSHRIIWLKVHIYFRKIVKCKCINYIKITMAVDGRTQSLSSKAVTSVNIGDDKVVLHVARRAISPGTESVRSRNK